jgi:hypothetical protein
MTHLALPPAKRRPRRRSAQAQLRGGQEDMRRSLAHTDAARGIEDAPQMRQVTRTAEYAGSLPDVLLSIACHSASTCGQSGRQAWAEATGRFSRDETARARLHALVRCGGEGAVRRICVEGGGANSRCGTELSAEERRNQRSARVSTHSPAAHDAYLPCDRTHLFDAARRL